MADTLQGKVIIVTGACGSVGRGAVKALADAGACLALVDRDANKIADIINNDLGGNTECYKGFPADLNDPDEVENMLKHVIEQFTDLDGLVHTVGGFAMGDPVHSANIDVFDKMMTLNARILYLVAGRVAKYMVDNEKQGTITAVLARSGKAGSKTQAAYTASKAAATRIVESMALELRDHGIRVNGVSPSIVDTPPNRDSMPNADFDKWVKPSEIGDLMVYLASDNASAITGANIEISGRS
jgi:NAD(P)-dependent dehydrogenase (short-subunit alcohol dehydrogenase family)